MASLRSAAPKYGLDCSRQTPHFGPPRVVPLQMEHVPDRCIPIRCYIAVTLSRVRRVFNPSEDDNCCLCGRPGGIARNTIAFGGGLYVAWSCLHCGFAGGDDAAMPMAWVLRFALLLESERPVFDETSRPIPRNRHAEQVQSKRDAALLLEGLGGRLQSIRKGKTHPSNPMATLAGHQPKKLRDTPGARATAATGTLFNPTCRR